MRQFIRHFSVPIGYQALTLGTWGNRRMGKTCGPGKLKIQWGGYSFIKEFRVSHWPKGHLGDCLDSRFAGQMPSVWNHRFDVALQGGWWGMRSGYCPPPIYWRDQEYSKYNWEHGQFLRKRQGERLWCFLGWKMQLRGRDWQQSFTMDPERDCGA